MKIKKGLSPETLSTDAVLRSVGYLRQTSPQGLPPEAMRDLEAYVAHLRSYYEIPEGHPVFPKRRGAAPQANRGKTSKIARNRLNHPWRGAL